MDYCFICGASEFESELKHFDPGQKYYRCSCKSNCGEFTITWEAFNTLNASESPYIIQKPKIAAYLCNHRISKRSLTRIYIEGDSENNFPRITLDEIINLFPKNVDERIDAALINLSILSGYTGQYIKIKAKNYPLLYTDSADVDSFIFMISYLKNMEFIESTDFVAENFSIRLEYESKIRLTPQGWSRIYQLNQGLVQSNTAFVAMWFNPDLNHYYDNAIKKAVEDTKKYEPKRVDREEYNDKIDDKIILEIRRCKFAICDITGHRSAVYFEAGFAMGLNKPIIWTCKKDSFDEKDKLCFDTRQYNHIVWENESDLYEKLYNRILATIL